MVLIVGRVKVISLGMPKVNSKLSIIKISLTVAKILSHLELTTVVRSDGERPDGASVIPWRNGKILVWDVTCSSFFSPSFLFLPTLTCSLVTRVLLLIGQST